MPLGRDVRVKHAFKAASTPNFSLDLLDADAQQLYTLAYASVATKYFKDDELRTFLHSFRKNNMEKNISGMLVHRQLLFLPLLLLLTGSPATVCSCKSSRETKANCGSCAPPSRRMSGISSSRCSGHNPSLNEFFRVGVWAFNASALKTSCRGSRASARFCRNRSRSIFLLPIPP